MGNKPEKEARETLEKINKVVSIFYELEKHYE